MKIIESKILEGISQHLVRYMRIDPENLQTTLAKILDTLNQKAWISKFALDLQPAYEIRATETVNRITNKFAECSDDNLISEAGEYVVSELAREAIISDTNYFDIPLAELIGKKIAGNPGFDFYSKNNSTHTIIFGEANYC